MSSRVSPARVLLVVSVLVPSLFLTACSGDEPDPTAEGGGGDATDSTTASVDPDKVSPTDLPELPQLRNAKGALDDVEFGDCVTEAGEQEVTGTVTNSTRKARDYAITVSWTNDESDVLARGVAVVERIDGGAIADFELSADVPGAATMCTYFVQRGNLV